MPGWRRPSMSLSAKNLIGRSASTSTGYQPKGESEVLEFKSSARWDYREERVTKVLEQVIVKTLAAFLNAKGGILLIGVDDSGGIPGLERDYATLGKRPDRDGYQQFLVQSCLVPWVKTCAPT